MQRLTIGILRNYSIAYDYNLTEQQLIEAYEELIWPDGIIKANEVFDTFENILSNYV